MPIYKQIVIFIKIVVEFVIIAEHILKVFFWARRGQGGGEEEEIE